MRRVSTPNPHVVQGSAVLSTKVLLDGWASVNRNGMETLRGHGQTHQSFWKTGIRTVWNSSVPSAVLENEIWKTQE